MPNKWTFTMKPIKELLERYVGDGTGWVDPFAGNNSPAKIRNDINKDCNAQSNMKAIPFLEQFEESSLKGILLDPPYSPRQISEHYKKAGLKPSQWETSSGWGAKIKDLTASRVQLGGIVICFGWNSMGLGKNRGFELIEVLLVPHGGAHNDTIVTVERKINFK